MSEIIKDFVKPEYDDPVMEMWEFFSNNPHYILLNYKYIKGGIRTFYAVVH